TEGTPNRNTELVSPNIRKSRRHQMNTEPSAGPAIRTIAVEHQRLALVPVYEPLNCCDMRRSWAVEEARARNVTRCIFRMRPGIHDQSTAIEQDAPDLLGADLLSFLIAFGECSLKDTARLGNYVSR